MANQVLLQLNRQVVMLLHLGMFKLILTRVSIMINLSNVLDLHQSQKNYWNVVKNLLVEKSIDFYGVVFSFHTENSNKF